MSIETEFNPEQEPGSYRLYVSIVYRNTSGELHPVAGTDFDGEQGLEWLMETQDPQVLLFTWNRLPVGPSGCFSDCLEVNDLEEGDEPAQSDCH